MEDMDDSGPPAPRRRFGWQHWLLSALFALVLIVAGAMVWLDTSSGHRFLAGRIARISPQSGLRIEVGGIEGSIYSKAVLRDLRLSDPTGAFFSAPRVQLDWWPFAWIINRLDIDRLIIPTATTDLSFPPRPCTKCPSCSRPARKGRSFRILTFA